MRVSQAELAVNTVNDTQSKSTKGPPNTPWGAPRRDHGAYELKFLLPDAVADAVLHWARTHLVPDPHADAALGDGYRVNSVYFDSAEWDVYHRVGWGRRRKFRLRRYGGEARVFLERKLKSSGLVRKRRTPVAESELAALEADSPPLGWPGHWFHRRVVARRLAPKCQIAYERIARIGMTPEGPVRFTLDRHIRCRAAAGFGVPGLVDGVPLLTGQSIVELKFGVAMPALFKTLTAQWALSPASVSKYRLSVAACGLATTTPRHSPDRPGHDLATLMHYA
jgi:hypothetical protein